MNLAIVFGKLNDFYNADKSFKKAVELDASDYLIKMNYII
jgi:hypothetical protein